MTRERENFESYYFKIYKERWEGLFSALKRDVIHKHKINSGLIKPYYIDYASYFAAEALDVRENENVLDLCAAPGGKSLCIALKLKESGNLVLNDSSKKRFFRLKNVIKEHLKYTKNISFYNKNARKWGLFEREIYDKILVDVPCSSERHLLKNLKYLNEWSPKRAKRLSIQAYSILSSAIMSLKRGGALLYSTCSINPRENEELIEKALMKKEIREEHIEDSENILQKSKHGYYIMPDNKNSLNLGPLYICKIQKLM